MTERLGLIAGNGRFPILFAQNAKKEGTSIVAVAIKGDTSKGLSKFVDKIYWISVGELDELFSILKKEGLKKAAMAGQVNPRHLFNRRLFLDEQLKSLLTEVADKRADSILGALAYNLEAQGIEVITPARYLQEFLVKTGTLTKRRPTERESQDITFGAGIAKAIAGIDIGQTVCIKDKSIIAVEAVDGTDATILRAGRIVREGLVVVKVSKPRQDMRFDLPVIGLKTIKILRKIKAGCLAVEADRTLFLDKGRALGLADKSGIAIVGQEIT